MAYQFLNKIKESTLGSYVILSVFIINLLTTQLSQAQESIPSIGKLKVSQDKLLRPEDSDIYLVHMVFDYFDNGKDIQELSVTTIYPDKKEERIVYSAESLSIEGPKGEAYYQIAYDAESQLGIYKYVFQLVDAKNNLSKEKSVTVTLQEHGEPQLSIDDISSKTAQPGDRITLRVTGLVTKPLSANNVSIEVKYIYGIIY